MVDPCQKIEKQDEVGTDLSGLFFTDIRPIFLAEDFPQLADEGCCELHSRERRSDLRCLYAASRCDGIMGISLPLAYVITNSSSPSIR